MKEGIVYEEFFETIREDGYASWKLFDKMLMFAMPLAACSILQQLFNSVGTAVVGRFASSEALAAVGSNSSVIALMVTLFSGISLWF